MRLLLPILALGLLHVACSQRVEPEEEYVEGESGRPVLPAEMTPPSLSGGQGRAAMTRTIPDEPSPQAIRGRVEWPGAGGGTVTSDAVLFLYVRAAGATGGPPLAAQRHPAGALPLEFAIGPESAIMAGTDFPEQVTVEARLDQDGNAMTSEVGDWEARSDAVAPGAEGVVLTLSQL